MIPKFAKFITETSLYFSTLSMLLLFVAAQANEALAYHATNGCMNVSLVTAAAVVIESK